MSYYNKPVDDPLNAQADLLCEQSNILYTLRLAIDGLETKDDTQRQGLVYLHDQLRAGHEKIFAMHDWLKNVGEDETKPKAA